MGIKRKLTPFVVRHAPTDFNEMLAYLHSHTKEQTTLGVPHSTYWAVELESGTVVGVINIRHKLTDKLFETGGHIGYGIRPTARGKGYATEMLTCSFEKVRALGISRALVCCDEDNVASERVIVKNGGKQTESKVDGGVQVKRFWIDLKKGGF
ncbi:GNAT family N-acetyltransferase [Shouchella patagoniensis]|uniref:GNAT family N-acetyltransferase n=1 Tax=Shouchella patagoniensis TaxID=228576 RepID=UPI000994B301|nr:GNAT family N-acetyltransferase [Shouchella patagoniensis]